MKLNIEYFPQHTNYSCGPVSLRMLFKHLGKDMSEEELIELCDAHEKVGTSNEHLVEEINNAGFNCFEKYNSKTSDIISCLESGYPVLVNYVNPLSGYGHYSIISGYDGDGNLFIFSDPSNGRDFSMNISEFEKRWHSGDEKSKGWLLIIGRSKTVINSVMC